MENIVFFDLLDRTTADALALARGLTPEQLVWAQEGRWSALQILEHICLAETSIGRILTRQAEKMSAQDEIVGNEKMYRLVVEERGRKITAPERMVPTGTITTVAEFERTFTAQREALKADLQSGAKVVDNRIFVHPAFGEMTMADWMYFSIRHTERHLDQIRENLEAMG
jgi:uncharacterized damage-inducible protein DinB